jgi:hypothetical protein
MDLVYGTRLAGYDPGRDYAGQCLEKLLRTLDREDAPRDQRGRLHLRGHLG